MGVYGVADASNKYQPQVDTNSGLCVNPAIVVYGVPTPNPPISDVQYTGCPMSVSKLVHSGISDMEPRAFVSINAPSGVFVDQFAVENSDLATFPVAHIVSAVAVNRNLYIAMQDAQGLSACAGSTSEACLPSITKAQALTLFSGWSPDWGLLDVAHGQNQVNICRIADGGGLQAMANRHFMELNCNWSSFPVADYGYSTVPLVGQRPSATSTQSQISQYLLDNVHNAQGQTFVFEAPETTDVVSCLEQAQAVGGYAIGHISKIIPMGPNWRHVKLDGVTPTRANARTGAYSYAYEATMQYDLATFSRLNRVQQDVINGLIEAFRTSTAVLRRLPGASQDGVLAPTTDYDIPITDPFATRVSRYGNSCNPLSSFR